MPPVDRNNPNARSPRTPAFPSWSSSGSSRTMPPAWSSCGAPATPTDGEHAECPKCEQARTFKRYATAQRRQSWTCTACGHHVHPTAGTIFHKSSTSLHLWFYAIYLMSSTRCGISAKQLEREIGVNYKTAHRMLRLIRTELMAQGYQGPLTGTVESRRDIRRRQAAHGAPQNADAQGIEPYSPSRAPGTLPASRPCLRWSSARGRSGRRSSPIVGASPLSRRSASASSQAPSSTPTSPRRLPPLTRTATRTRPYRRPPGLRPRRRSHEHRRGILRAWLKGGILGTYHSVSPTWLESYVNEYVWRYNHRDDDAAQFRTLLDNAASKLAGVVVQKPCADPGVHAVVARCADPTRDGCRLKLDRAKYQWTNSMLLIGSFLTHERRVRTPSRTAKHSRGSSRSKMPLQPDIWG